MVATCGSERDADDTCEFISPLCSRSVSLPSPQDPHYCGGEDIETITKKDVALEGYKDKPCGWRGPDHFDKHSFYNLCVPERPKII